VGRIQLGGGGVQALEGRERERQAFREWGGKAAGRCIRERGASIQEEGGRGCRGLLLGRRDIILLI
jgi:hypothetical protein